MKLFVLSTLLAAARQASAFAPSSTTHYRTTSLMANVLEGREIEKDFTPINNMLLVKRAEVIDQTVGGLFLTGKVSSVDLICLFASFDSFQRLQYSNLMSSIQIQLQPAKN